MYILCTIALPILLEWNSDWNNMLFVVVVIDLFYFWLWFTSITFSILCEEEVFYYGLNCGWCKPYCCTSWSYLSPKNCDWVYECSGEGFMLIGWISLKCLFWKSLLGYIVLVGLEKRRFGVVHTVVVVWRCHVDSREERDLRNKVHLGKSDF